MVIVILGVSGSGKTTIGKMLAHQQHWQFRDADEFHSPANIQKMHDGIPLDDADRRPWLEAIRHAIDTAIRSDTNLILACSALKAAYRQVLTCSDRVKFVYLRGSFELIQQRLQARHGHFMNPELLKSQFDDLEEPTDAIAIDIAADPQASVRQIVAKLHL